MYLHMRLFYLLIREPSNLFILIAFPPSSFRRLFNKLKLMKIYLRVDDKNNAIFLQSVSWRN